MPSEWLVEQRRIKTLNCDRQPLENERPFSAVTRHFANLAAKVFEEMICRVVHWAHLRSPWQLEGNCMLKGCRRISAISWQQRVRDHLSMSTGCGSDIRVCQGAHKCDVSYQQLPWAPYNLCRPMRALPSRRIRPTGSSVAGCTPADNSAIIFITGCKYTRKLLKIEIVDTARRCLF